MEERILGEQRNEFSENLQRIHKRDRLFFPLLCFFVAIVTATVYVHFKKSTNPYGIVILYVAVIFLPIAVYLQYRHMDGTYPRSIYYSNAGIRWVTRRNKEIFVTWDDIIKVSPIGDYGRIMGYGNGKVSDYILYFKKPFPGYTPVSAEVARKIEEYLREFREKEGFLSEDNK